MQPSAVVIIDTKRRIRYRIRGNICIDVFKPSKQQDWCTTARLNDNQLGATRFTQENVEMSFFIPQKHGNYFHFHSASSVASHIYPQKRNQRLIPLAGSRRSAPAAAPAALPAAAPAADRTKDPATAPAAPPRRL